MQRERGRERPRGEGNASELSPVSENRRRNCVLWFTGEGEKENFLIDYFSLAFHWSIKISILMNISSVFMAIRSRRLPTRNRNLFKILFALHRICIEWKFKQFVRCIGPRAQPTQTPGCQMHPHKIEKSVLLVVLSQTAVAENKTLPICVLAERNSRSESPNVHRGALPLDIQCTEDRATGRTMPVFAYGIRWWRASVNDANISGCIWHIVRDDMQHYNGMTSMWTELACWLYGIYLDRSENELFIDCAVCVCPGAWAHGAWNMDCVAEVCPNEYE